MLCETPQGGGSLLRSIALGHALRERLPSSEVFFAVPPHQASIVADLGLIVVRRLSIDPMLDRALTERERSRRLLTLALLNTGQVLSTVAKLRPSILILDGIPTPALPTRVFRGRTVVLLDSESGVLQPSSSSMLASEILRRSLQRRGVNAADTSLYLGTPDSIPAGASRDWATRHIRFTGFFNPSLQPEQSEENTQPQQDLVAVVQEDTMPVSWLHEAARLAYGNILKKVPSARMALAGINGLDAVLTPEHPEPMPVTKATWVDLKTVTSLAHVTIIEARPSLLATLAGLGRNPLQVARPRQLGGKLALDAKDGREQHGSSSSLIQSNQIDDLAVALSTRVCRELQGPPTLASVFPEPGSIVGTDVLLGEIL